MAWSKDFKAGFKYNSLTTPDFSHGEFCFAAEIMTYRYAFDNGDKLPPFFWRKATECDEKYKKHYTDAIECCRKMMKAVPAHFVIQCLVYTKNLKTSNYGYITTVVKNKWEKWQERAAKRIKNTIEHQVLKDSISEEMQVFADETPEEEITVKGGRKRNIRL